MAMDTGSNYSSYLNTGTWNHNIGYGPWTITAWIRSNDLRSTNQRYFFYGPSGPFIIFSADGNSPSSSPSVYSSGAFGSFGIKFQDGGKWQHFLVTRTSVAGGSFFATSTEFELPRESPLPLALTISRTTPTRFTGSSAIGFVTSACSDAPPLPGKSKRSLPGKTLARCSPTAKGTSRFEDRLPPPWSETSVLFVSHPRQ